MNETMNQKKQITLFLKDYTQRHANPDRLGCPTFEMLEAFLCGQLDQGVVTDLCDHLPRCRECLLELKSLRDMMREEIQAIDKIEPNSPAWDELEAVLV